MMSDDQEWLTAEPPASTAGEVDSAGSRPEWFALNLILGMTVLGWVAAVAIRAMFS